jgi:DNA modification methylase
MKIEQLHHGDCLEVLKTMAANSVDSIVTDPPYGLSFMGKKWDYDVPSVEVWAECLRVLKPGGHLLAFAGTRTQHRMAVRIEDAGFEIRDMIAWVYSTGFPKSHNFGCKCSRDALPYSHEENLPREPKAERDLHPLRDADVSSSMDSSQGRGEVLQQSVPESGTSNTRRKEFSAAEIREGESSMEGRGDILEETRQLQTDQIRPVSSGVPTDGEEGRIHHGASLDNGADNWKVPDADRSGASCKSQSAGQQTGESGAFSKQRSAQERGMEADQVCAKCGKLSDWQGWGTALKPALEPITVARKPLGEKTVAANVLEHGTGAINVDGCRVKGDMGADRADGKPRRTDNTKYGKANETINPQSPLGRWPANLIHDGSDEVVELFPQSASGAPADLSKYRTRSSGFGMCGGSGGKGDSGSAARFFYCAKASKKDRDEGCEGLELNARGRTCYDSQYHEGGGKLPPRTGNNHPTVKPTALMRYLCRLVTPPGGMVLDPFMGSGSTGKAAVLEGFRFIGIERDADYLEIAKARIIKKP